MTNWTPIPAKANVLVVWDPAMSGGPYSTQWDGVITTWKDPNGNTVKWIGSDGNPVTWGDATTTWLG